MKIKKLYTLSQFVDYLNKLSNAEKKNLLNLDLYYNHSRDGYLLYFLIHRYNEFLKQPLKKEMFVNEIKKPIWDTVDSSEYILFEKWKEVEKKVIFDNLAQSSINYDWDTIKIIYPTLQDLALTTNGKIELKNVEL